MKIKFEEVVQEITELTGMSEEYVKDMVWKEALDKGSVVSKEAKKWFVHPHIYDENMEKFYVESDAFIFELMVESCREGKQIVVERIKERIENYIKMKCSEKINILLFGDGVGSDTISLYQTFQDKAEIFYYDIPGSKTYEFAVKRFKKRDMKINFLTDYYNIHNKFFDVVICLEVLEHLPDPLALIKKFNEVLKDGGICLITESFEAVLPEFPTHLKKNLKYAYQTPFLFLKNNLYLTYYPRSFPYKRPMEFKKIKNISIKERLRLYTNSELIIPLIRNYLKLIFKKALGKI